MNNIKELFNRVASESAKKLFSGMYFAQNEEVNNYINRYQKLIKRYSEIFTDNSVEIFSTPGRTEIGGNHTDHNHGLVLAGSINLDTLSVVGKTQNKIITIYSEGYEKPFIVDLNHLEIIDSEKGSSNSLIRGIAARFIQLGLNIGGFNACMTSDVLVGSGLSSSASFEVQIGTILNSMFNENKLDNIEIAKIGQWAENNFFGKPCGLMDQIACAIGGIVAIDFNDPAEPVVEAIPFDFKSADYSLIVVNTGGSHADLTDDYSSIPSEMKEVAGEFNKSFMRGVKLENIIADVASLREKTGDRALLRAFHFLKENERVTKQVDCLKKNKFAEFLKLINESGNSSFKFLQNCYTEKDIKSQGISLSLALTENFINQIGEGACRVHGGGFAGTIQAFLPNNQTESYIGYMERIFGHGSAMKLAIRAVGSISVEI